MLVTPVRSGAELQLVTLLKQTTIVTQAQTAPLRNVKDLTTRGMLLFVFLLIIVKIIAITKRKPIHCTIQLHRELTRYTILVGHFRLVKSRDAIRLAVAPIHHEIVLAILFQRQTNTGGNLILTSSSSSSS